MELDQAVNSYYGWLPKRLFWEFRVQEIKWKAASRMVIGRVME